MKQRLISALIGLGVMVVVLVFFDTPVLNVVIAAITVLAVFEILQVAGCTKFKLLTITCIAMAALIQFFNFHMVFRFFPFLCYAFVLLLFGLLIAQHEKLPVEKIGFSFMICMAIPFSTYILIYIRDRFVGTTVGLFYIVMALGAAWLTDSGAYFTGRAFGKHKMSPKISPKKTVEGAVGGVVVCVLCMLLLGWLYQSVAGLWGETVHVNFLNILITAPIASMIAILGDLAASVIKRQFGVKDYGHIMPGHGGVMDRFDSVLFVLPMMMIFVHFLPFVAV